MQLSKETLKKNQPVAWKIISNGLKNHRIPHAVMLSGPKSAPKSQLALLMAQSLVCEHPDDEGFACLECDSCRQCGESANADVLWKKADLKDKEKPGAYRIKKGEIADIQQRFATGAVGPAQRQVYILENYEAATPEASNALLKFLEEPKDGLYGILTADETGSILPTILSRVQQIMLRPASMDIRRHELKQALEDDQLAEMLASNGFNIQTAAPFLEMEDSPVIREAAYSFWNRLDDHEALLHLQLELYTLKNFKQNKNGVRLFLYWLLYFAKENQAQADLKGLKIRKILLETLDQVDRPVDLSLLLDQTFYKIRNAFQEEKQKMLEMKFKSGR